jgi:hypothetical protein
VRILQDPDGGVIRAVANQQRDALPLCNRGVGQEQRNNCDGHPHQHVTPGMVRGQINLSVPKRKTDQNAMSLREQKVRPKVRCVTALRTIAFPMGLGALFGVAPGVLGDAWQQASLLVSARGVESKGARKKSRRPPRHRSSALVVIAVDLLKEGLGVECVGLAGDAGDYRKRNQGGQDGLHGISPLISYPLQRGCKCGLP